MTTAYQRIENDLYKITGITNSYGKPFNDRDKPRKKSISWMKEWRKSKLYRNSNQQMILYYDLGETLEKEELPMITQHQKRIAKRVYRIYEPLERDSLAINREAKINDFKLISQYQVEKLREIALVVLSE